MVGVWNGIILSIILDGLIIGTVGIVIEVIQALD